MLCQLFPLTYVVLSSIHTDLRGYMDMINFCTFDKQRKSLRPYLKSIGTAQYRYFLRYNPKILWQRPRPSWPQMRFDNFVGSNEFSVYLLDEFSLKLRRAFFKRTLPLLMVFVVGRIRNNNFELVDPDLKSVGFISTAFAVFVGAFNNIVKVVHFY